MVHRCGRAAAAAFTGTIAAVILAAGLSAPARAQPADVFSVTHVSVDVTTEAAASAREAALVQGQRAAFRRLLQRLTLRRDHVLLPDLGDEEILDYVQGLEVEEEKASSVRYLAELTVRFKPDPIRGLLRAAGIQYAETISKPVLVLPVYQTAGTLILWDRPNPWREAWAGLDSGGGLVPLVVPEGSLADVAEIGAEQAVHAVQERLDAIARRYGAADTVVATAALTRIPGGGGPTIDVAVSRFGAAITDRMTILSFAADPDGSVDDLLKRAATEVAAQVEEEWKQDNLLRFGPEGTLSAMVPLEGLADWLAVRGRLEGVAFIRDAELVSLSRNVAVVNLRYIGDIGQLRLALAQSDLDLFEGATSWILRLLDGAAQNAAR
jgi:hypothetical protein